jgi:outer membrane lipoprotein-sorting protein
MHSDQHKLRFGWALLTLLLIPGTLFGAEKKELTPAQIVQRFAAKESEFRKVWETYTYTQRILFQVLGRSNQVREQREMIVEVYFTKEGKRETRVVSDRGELVSVGVTREDMSDAISLQPFVLTTEELSKYEIKFEGKEQVDELYTYVFEVKPKKKERGERYFQGKIWVDDLDLQIVMTRGKIVPDYANNKFPEFETVREQIDGAYWFPTWTEADDVLFFGDSWRGGRRVHIRQLITYSDYQQFKVGTAIKYGPVSEP